MSVASTKMCANTLAMGILLDGIPADNFLCAIRLSGSITQMKRHRLSVQSVHPPTESSSSWAKDEFCRDLSRVLRNLRSTNIVIAAGDLNS